MLRGRNYIHNYKHIILNKHVSLKLSLTFFDSAVSPMATFSLAVLPLGKNANTQPYTQRAMAKYHAKNARLITVDSNLR